MLFLSGINFFLPFLCLLLPSVYALSLWHQLLSTLSLSSSSFRLCSFSLASTSFYPFSVFFLPFTIFFSGILFFSSSFFSFSCFILSDSIISSLIFFSFSTSFRFPSLIIFSTLYFSSFLFSQNFFFNPLIDLHNLLITQTSSVTAFSTLSLDLSSRLTAFLRYRNTSTRLFTLTYIYRMVALGLLLCQPPLLLSS